MNVGGRGRFETNSFIKKVSMDFPIIIWTIYLTLICCYDGLKSKMLLGVLIEEIKMFKPVLNGFIAIVRSEITI